MTKDDPLVVWLKEELSSRDPHLQLHEEGIRPPGLPLAEAERILVSYKDQIHLSREALYLTLDEEPVRLPWERITRRIDNTYASGNWEFKTAERETYKVPIRGKPLRGPIGDRYYDGPSKWPEVIDICIRELGHNGRQRIPEGERPPAIWEFDKVHRRHEDWIAAYLEPRYPELVPKARALFEARIRTRETGKLEGETLATVLECARTSRRPLVESAVGVLAWFSAESERVREEIRVMSKDSNATIRFNAMISVGKRTPLEFTLEILRRGLQDKSSRVRQKAADKALRLDLTQMEPDIQERLEAETNPKARKTLEFCVDCFRTGKHRKIFVDYDDIARDLREKDSHERQDPQD